MTQARDPRMDNLKGILIGLVVYAHFIALYVDRGVASIPVNTIYNFIFSFHMPLFVFVSGYFSKNLEGARRGAFRSLLLPFLFFNTLMAFYCHFVQGRDFFFLTPLYVYWYLLSLLVWRLSLKDLVKIRFILPASIVISLLSGYLYEVDNFLGLSRTVNFLPFFLLGYWTKPEHIERVKKRGPVVALVLLFGCVACVYSMTEQGLLSTWIFITDPYRWPGEILLRLVFYVLALSIGLALIGLTPSRRVPLLTRAGEYSLLIFILHRYVSFAVNWAVPVEKWNDLYAIPLLLLTVLTVVLLGSDTVSHSYRLTAGRLFDALAPCFNDVRMRSSTRLLILLSIVAVLTAAYLFRGQLGE